MAFLGLRSLKILQVHVFDHISIGIIVFVANLIFSVTSHRFFAKFGRVGQKS